MKTTILANGTLSIKPESELEAFALNQWGTLNLHFSDWYKKPLENHPKIIVDCSEYAERMGLFVTIAPFDSFSMPPAGGLADLKPCR